MCGDCCKMSPISVLPHEEVILKKLGELLDVDVRFTPGYTVYEAIRGVNLAFSYVMQLNTGGQCPFLRNNKCTIHYIYKPYICRSFPYIPRHVKYSIDEVNKYI
ncbi:MAG: YkgJ family cysteine cluster protein, partial [Desulfurococcaceae archaeon]